LRGSACSVSCVTGTVPAMSAPGDRRGALPPGAKRKGNPLLLGVVRADVPSEAKRTATRSSNRGLAGCPVGSMDETGSRGAWGCGSNMCLSRSPVVLGLLLLGSIGDLLSRYPGSLAVALGVSTPIRTAFTVEGSDHSGPAAPWQGSSLNAGGVGPLRRVPYPRSWIRPDAGGRATCGKGSSRRGTGCRQHWGSAPRGRRCVPPPCTGRRC